MFLLRRIVGAGERVTCTAMGCIVVTTDLSPESQRAFAPAVELAERLGQPIVLLSVFEDPPFEPSGGGLVTMYPDRARLHRDWEERVHQVAASIQAKVPVRAVVVDSMDVPRAIADFVHAQGAAYLAMASHGRSGLRRLLLGSVAEAVLRHAHVPVIVYPPPAG
jgi:nucleotide-binding universal stress UspA family protein